MVEIFQAVCAQAVDDEDGLVFDPDSVRAERTREDEDYRGARVTMMVMLGGARLPLQVDIGFGDAVTPGARDIDYPSLIDLPMASLRAYPPETVVAEKLEAAVSLGMLNSRMKDFFDLWVISRTFKFDGAVLGRAVAATFERRGTALPEAPPVALTEAFAANDAKQAQWRPLLVDCSGNPADPGIRPINSRSP